MAIKFITRGTRNLVVFNLYRTFTSVYGLLYILVGTIFPLILFWVLITSIGTLITTSAGSTVFVTTVSAMVPLMAAVGGFGVIYFFSTDRSNGVYEYLIATRKVSVTDIFMSFSIVTVTVVSLIVGVNVAVIFVLSHFYASSISFLLLKMFAVFSVPVAYISSLISILAMLTWSAMSKTYPGVNAPGGIGSVIGVIPPMAFLLSSRYEHLSNPLVTGGIFSITLLVIFVITVVVIVKRISNERMLS